MPGVRLSSVERVRIDIGLRICGLRWPKEFLDIWKPPACWGPLRPGRSHSGRSCTTRSSRILKKRLAVRDQPNQGLAGARPSELKLGALVAGRSNQGGVGASLNHSVIAWMSCSLESKKTDSL